MVDPSRHQSPALGQVSCQSPMTPRGSYAGYSDRTGPDTEPSQRA